MYVYIDIINGMIIIMILFILFNIIRVNGLYSILLSSYQNSSNNVLIKMLTSISIVVKNCLTLTHYFRVRKNKRDNEFNHKNIESGLHSGDLRC